MDQSEESIDQRVCPDCGAELTGSGASREHRCAGSPATPGAEDIIPPHGGISPPNRGIIPPHGGTSPPAGGPDPGQRFRELVNCKSEDPLPEALLEQIPEEMREALSSRSQPAAKKEAELRPDTAQALRDRGYVVTEDSRGTRISGMPSGKSPGSQLSASDIVRVAAELEGGVQPPGNLQTCSKCQARTPPGEPNCQWCGEPFGDPTDQA